MEGAPNILSTLVFFLYVPFSLWCMKRWPPAKGTTIAFLTGVLFLPEIVTFTIPGIPAFEKTTLISMWVFIGIAAFHRERLTSLAFPSPFKWCVGLLLVGGVFSVFLNMDPLNYGSSYVPAHRPYDVIHFTITRTLTMILPFVIGMVMFRDSNDLRQLLQALVTLALFYSVLQIGEIILSPQFNRWLYGYHQHSFAQTMRGGGFRPMVFMSHGLALALFTSLATIAAAALHKARLSVLGFPAKWATGYLALILVASRSVAAMLYGLVSIPLVLFVRPRLQVALGLVLASTLILYPTVRAMELIPVDDINEIVLEHYGVDKVGSLTVRFENEAAMLDKALERIWFGWGWHCRGCHYDTWSGAMISVRDGAWIKELGDGGVVGFFGHFWLLVFPVLALFRRIRSVPREADRRLLAALSLMVGWSAFDLIPNGNYNTLYLLYAGALHSTLAGILQATAVARRRRREERARLAREARGAMAT
ncbi:MAG: hypothetical protein AAGF92_19270 [Myxococcota bacterium]